MDHALEAVARLITQYKETNVEDLITALASSPQSAEDGVQTLRNRTLATAVGAQLDGLGRIVGQLRLGFSDDVYRLWLTARILLNRCGGTAPEIIRIFSTLVPAATIKLVESYPAGIVLSVLGEVTADEAVALLAIAREAKPAGIRLNFVWNLADPSTIFTLDGTPAQSLDAGTLAGESS